MSKSPLIIVPKPGEFLGLVGATGALSDAAASAAADAAANAAAESKKLNDALFKQLVNGNFDNKAAVDAVNDFTRMQMREDGFFKRIMPPIQINDDELDLSVDTDKPVKVAAKESHLLEFFAYETVGALIGHVGGLLGVDFGEAGPGGLSFNGSIVQEDPFAEHGVDIAFWYYRNTLLIYSVRRVADNFFYDFANKRFSLLPASPRAGLPRVMEATAAGTVYSTKLSGKLDDGEYVVTIRDSEADDVVVGIMALFMAGGKQVQTPPKGLEDTPIEDGIPTPGDTYRCAGRRVRPVDTDDRR